MTALESDTPKMVLPNVHEEIHYGARIELLGCGTFLRPLPYLNEALINSDPGALPEVIAAVQDCLQLRRQDLKGRVSIGRRSLREAT